METQHDVDVLIIGSGMGGSTAAWALKDLGVSVLVLERGDVLPRESENWSPQEVFINGRYRNAENWLEVGGAEFAPGNYYYVGGNTKLFGAVLSRYRESDFISHPVAEGVTKGWPIEYGELEPFYDVAEELYRVHGNVGQDPTDPWRSRPYPYPGLEHEPDIQRLADGLARQGLHPFSLPVGIDLREGGKCIRCRTCDGFPCKLDAKLDAEVGALTPALESPNVELWTNSLVTRIFTDQSNSRVAGVHVIRAGEEVVVRAKHIVLAGGAVNSAALLLRSGIANSSDQVGRNYMVHNSTFMVAVDPRKKNNVFFQKSLAFNDWYEANDEAAFPLGNVQMLGKLQTEMIQAARRYVPKNILRFMTQHSVDMYLTSEDLPSAKNRVTLNPDGQIQISWKPTNFAAHEALVASTRRVVRKAGYPMVFSETMGIATNSHQCGTLMMGDDPKTSVVSPEGFTHDLGNLWVCDSSVFPTSAAVNPALTIAANALRVCRNGIAPSLNVSMSRGPSTENSREN